MLIFWIEPKSRENLRYFLFLFLGEGVWHIVNVGAGHDPFLRNKYIFTKNIVTNFLIFVNKFSKIFLNTK